MTSASLEMSASAVSESAPSRARLDEILATLKDNATAFARLPPAEKASLLRACMPRLQAVAPQWVAAATEAKGLGLHSPAASEEWLGGPMATMRNLRLLAESLDRIAAGHKPGPDDSRVRVGADGRTEVEVFPSTAIESALYAGFTATVRMEPGLSPADVRRRQAAFYDQRAPEGGVSLVLGAGNVASIPPMDALYKMIFDGHVCLVKLNPVNEYLQPFFEEALEPLVSRGFLRFVRGSAEEGAYLVNHPLVDDVHITGSDRTHDRIVWGTTEEEQARRKAEGKPLLTKPISSELGCVTPVVVVPGPYTDAELQFVAENIATMVANNASCNCNAGKMIVLGRTWPQRADLMRRVKAVLATVPPRKAYYPGAFDRYTHLVGDRTEGVTKLGEASGEVLPWTVVEGLDPKSGDRLFTTEPFCPIVSQTTLPDGHADTFLDEARRFCNDTLWGTLSAVVIIHPRSEAVPEVGAALARFVAEVRYGAVGINHWSALAYALVSTPWGAHPSSTLDNIQGGLGWVHNTYLLDGIEKVVVRGPLTVFPKPPWFVTHRRAHEVAEKIVDLERDPKLWKVLPVALSALRG